MLALSGRRLAPLLALGLACAGGDDSGESSATASTESSATASTEGTATASTEGTVTAATASESTGTDASTTDGGEPSACVAAGTLLCERACACDPTPGCKVASTQGTTLFFDDLADCRGLYVQGNCIILGGSPLIDYEVCLADIDPEMCSALVADAIEIPMSCTEADR
jgi:hypothetical protein